MSFHPLTPAQYDEIAGALHTALMEYEPTDSDQAHSWYGVREAAAKVCALFDGDPGFDRERFGLLVMVGHTAEDHTRPDLSNGEPLRCHVTHRRYGRCELQQGHDDDEHKSNRYIWCECCTNGRR